MRHQFYLLVSLPLLAFVFLFFTQNSFCLFACTVFMNKPSLNKESFLRKAITKESDFESAKVQLALMLLERGDLAATKEVVGSFKSKPVNAESSLFCKGQVAEKEAKYREALDFYEEAWSLNGHYLPAIKGVGRVGKKIGSRSRVLKSKVQVHILSNQPHQAQKLLDEYLESNPKDVRILPIRASLLFRFGQFEKALKDYQYVIKKRTRNIPVYIKLGQVYHALGKIDNAFKVLEKASRLDPGNAKVYDLLGDYEKQRGDFLKAKEYYITASELYGKNGKYVNNVKAKRKASFLP